MHLMSCDAECEITFRPCIIIFQLCVCPQPNASRALNLIPIWRVDQFNLGLKRRSLHLSSMSRWTIEDKVAKVILLQPEGILLHPPSVSPLKAIRFGFGFHQCKVASLPYSQQHVEYRVFDDHTVVPRYLTLVEGCHYFQAGVRISAKCLHFGV